MTVTKACQDDGNLDAKHTDPKMAVFKETALETLEMKK